MTPRSAPSLTCRRFGKSWAERSHPASCKPAFLCLRPSQLPPPPLKPWRRIAAAVARAIGQLESGGHFGPFAVVLGQNILRMWQTPQAAGDVLPQDQIIPFLGGGPLLRCSVLIANSGVVVALGGAPVELVVATDVSLQFLQVTNAPMYFFRVREKMALRIKEADAIISAPLGLSRRKACPLGSSSSAAAWRA